MVTERITANGAICDRCDQGTATKANYRVECYEYVCDDCLTPAERVAFGAEAAQ